MVKFNHYMMLVLMENKRWRAADISDITGISHRTIRKYMKGDCADITLKKVGLIADALGVDISKLLMRC